MDWVAAFGFHFAESIDWLADNVQHSAERSFADRHRYLAAGVDRLHSANEAFGWLHRDRAYATVAEVLRHFADDIDRLRHFESVGRDPQSVINRRHMISIERDVDDRTDYLNYASHLDAI
jgi:hypothetical protein